MYLLAFKVSNSMTKGCIGSLQGLTTMNLLEFRSDSCETCGQRQPENDR